MYFLQLCSFCLNLYKLAKFNNSETSSLNKFSLSDYFLNALNRMQKAREKRSRQSDVMSDIENMDVMLSESSRNEIKGSPEDRNNEKDLVSDKPRQKMIRDSEDFRLLLNTNSRENSEISIETARLRTLRSLDKILGN